MADEKFNIGDVVQLKSGGPKMTVTHVGQMATGGTTLTAWCAWFDGTKEMSGTFPVGALNRA
jgi:uncharacterized protein YodC (DUF2158 family)